MFKRKSTVDRFKSYVDKRTDDECWPWTGCRNSDGYGSFRVGTKTALAHRASYIAHGKGNPTGMVVRHTCDNRCCVNPHHLVIGTHADNVRDMTERQRQSRGEGHYCARLTAGIVVEARQRRSRGESPHTMAKEYGVHYRALQKAIYGETWAHVPGALPRPGKLLTADNVIEARQRRLNGENVYAMAKEYGVKAATLYNAIYGDTWAHVPGALPRPPKRGSRA